MRITRQKAQGSSQILLVVAILASAITLIAGRQQTPPAKAKPSSPQGEVRKLEAGKPVERELKGGESHVYEIALKARQFLNAVVEQRGIDVLVQVTSANNRPVLEVDSPNGNKGDEPVMLIAETTGVYRLKVSSLEKNAPLGKYEVRVLSIRAASEKDRAVVAQYRLLQEAQKLADEAQNLRSKASYAQAVPLAERVLELREKALGKEHPLSAQSLNNLAELYLLKGDYKKAELFHRVLALTEKVKGPDHPDTAAALNNLAELHRSKGEYGKAEPLILRALAIKEKAFGPEHPSTALTLNNLAGLYKFRGDYAKAEPLYLRALAVNEKTLGPEHAATATALNNLAELYKAKGDDAKAEPLYVRALAIKEKTLGPEHPATATALNNLADLYDSKGEIAKAESLYVRALAITEKALGKEHPSTALSLNNLAVFYDQKGDYGKSEALYLRALAIYEKAFGAEHPDIARTLNNLAGMYSLKGDYTKAEPLMLRALAIREKLLGAEHSLTTFSLNSVAGFYLATGDYAKAIAFQIRANETDERDLARNLASGSERQKLAYLNRYSRVTDTTLTLHLRAAPTNAEIRSAALTRLLRRKGRALDAMTDAIAVLRRHATAEDQSLLDELAEVRSQHANLVTRGPGREGFEQYTASLKALQEAEEQLENRVSKRSSELRAQVLPITLEAVQQAIPEGAALVEFAAYRPYDAKTKKFGATCYAVYLLTHQGEIAFADLGEARPIDQLVADWRNRLRQKESDIERQVKPLARQLDEKIMRPVRQLLGDKRRLLISPDGALNLIPFDALLDEQNHYLVEKYAISYLTSGRDLLRLQTARPSRQAALVFADPDFDSGAAGRKADKGNKSRVLERVDEAQEGKSKTSHRSTVRSGPKLGSIQLEPLEELPGSAKEGKDLKKLLQGATVLTGADATEAAIKRAANPSILHISTHGGFLEDAAIANPDQGRGLFIRTEEADRSSNSNFAQPLLRAGLFFAGANIGKSGDDDGVLTALEAAGLDLYGTKLVILSACDTGVGEVKNGDGVYGLRRAFVLAGAETQVMSLWPVSDKGTRELMVDYYKRLKAGEGRAAALRQVQLEMLKDAKRRHPFYWASFIQSGEWANLDGKRVN
jgi:CHAT domain-containing protein/Flp pilus assembly protein TadD